MSSSRLTSKGQVTIPKPVRERLGIRPGDEVEFVECDDGVRVRRKLRDNPLEQWRGYLKHLAGQDIDALIDDWRGR